MTAEVSITTAICTWNRSKSLRATLTSLQQLIIPPGIDWEVLIVNNNCTDDTDDVIEKSPIGCQSFCYTKDGKDIPMLAIVLLQQRKAIISCGPMMM